MFTNRTTALARFDEQCGLRLVRDCEFAFVGKVPTRLNQRLVPCGSARHLAEAAKTAGIVGIITTAELAEQVPNTLGLAIADDPVAASLRVHEALLDIKDFQWRDHPSQIDPTAIVHPAAVVEPRNVTIGPETIIAPGAIVCERSVIGAHCRIGPGVVVGCDAFEVDMTATPIRVLRQGGGVLLEDHVEIEAKSTVVRATFGGFTRLGRETKLDCQVHIAHDCDIGRRVRLAACAEVSGRVAIGDDVFVGPNSTISNGLTIGGGATISLGAVVVRDVEAGERVTGNFALPHAKWLNFMRTVR